jgi:hypothetical protein
MAAMRQSRFFFATKSPRKDPEIVSATPHEIFLSPHREIQTRHRIRGWTSGAHDPEKRLPLFREIMRQQKASADLSVLGIVGCVIEDRLDYVSVTRVPLVVSFHRAGFVFGIHRRFR